MRSFKGHYVGKYNFIVRLVDENGQFVSGLFNETSSFELTYRHMVQKTGTYYLDVDTVISAESWTITIE
ncbi:hypothetical protein D3C86_1464500 [compost metagenome]